MLCIEVVFRMLECPVSCLSPESYSRPLDNAAMVARHKPCSNYSCAFETPTLVLLNDI
jgi:hypothetical protein